MCYLIPVRSRSYYALISAYCCCIFTPRVIRMAANNTQDIEKIEQQSLLYDFYGDLLSSSQNQVMALYHEDNLSLSEIASELGMTRQAVHYTLKKAERALGEYEDKLGLVETYHRGQVLAARAKDIISCSIGSSDSTAAEELLSIIDKLSE